MLEAAVLKLVMLKLSKLGATVFRQNVGQAWAGRKIVKGQHGTILIEGPMPVTMGLTRGSSDLIGWTTVVITADMVGADVAVFTAIECKRSKGGRTSTDQKRFISRVKEAGGIAGVAASPEAAANILNQWRPRF
tara:strand:+ start:861 stop:1262 length:402 start_codon:yes stop_codon:yes gene_type:complete